MAYENNCERYDCCLQSKYKKGECAALSTAYKDNKDCPFYKKHLSDVNRGGKVDLREIFTKNTQPAAETYKTEIEFLEKHRKFVANKFPDDWKKIDKTLALAIDAFRLLAELQSNSDKMLENSVYRFHTMEELPPNDERQVLCYFSNFSLPMLGRFEGNEEEGYRCYVGDMDETFLESGLFVNGWREIPKGRDADE